MSAFLHGSLWDSILASVSGVDFGSLLVDFGVQESILRPHSQCLALGADFVHLGVGFGVCKNIVPSYDNFDKNTTKLQYNINTKTVNYL